LSCPTLAERAQVSYDGLVAIIHFHRHRDIKIDFIGFPPYASANLEVSVYNYIKEDVDGKL
jgi:hypothetical protein